MSKPTWRPNTPKKNDGKPDPRYVLCQGCGWRSVQAGDPWCATCRARAAEMGGPKEAPQPPVIRHGQRSRMSTAARKAFHDAIDANNAKITADYLAARRGRQEVSV